MSLKPSSLICQFARPARLSKTTWILTPRLRAADIRWNSAQSTEPTQPRVNKHRNFYKEFGRPVAKVFLMAVFTYQFTYWLWLKLDMDEIVAGRESEVKVLEAKLEAVMKGKEKKG